MNPEDAPDDVAARLWEGDLTEAELAELVVPCPMGCGSTTDDVAGGPCSACWDLVT